MSEEQKEAQEPNTEEHKSSKNEQEPESYEDRLQNLETILEEEDFKLVKSAFEQKKHWRNKHDRVFAELSELRTQSEKKEEIKEQKQEPKKAENPDFEIKLAKLEIKDFARDKGLNLDKSDLDHVFAMAKGYGVDPAEVLDNPIFKSYLTNKQQEKKDAGAEVSSSGKIVAKKSGQKEYSLDELTEMAMKNPAKYEAEMKKKYG